MAEEVEEGGTQRLADALHLVGDEKVATSFRRVAERLAGNAQYIELVDALRAESDRLERSWPGGFQQRQGG